MGLRLRQLGTKYSTSVVRTAVTLSHNGAWSDSLAPM